MMGYSNKLMFLLIVLNIFHQITGQQMQLVAGHVLYRHGDRTPLTTFPSDPVKPSDWPNGFGQLTKVGIEQQHRLGKFIRNRYNTILSTNYTPNEIVVRSTDVDRTLMSAQSNLVGLYPVLNLTTDQVPIQPIPIHTVSINLDFLLGQNDCPRYDQLVAQIEASEDVRKSNAYYQPFFDKLQIWTNLTNLTVYNAWDIADTIFVENIYHKLPSWAEDLEVQRNLSDINELAFHYLFFNNDTQRIRGGPSIQDIWYNMDNLVNGKSYINVKMYSAHDTTLSAVLSFLRINYPHQPQYASALFVDLYRENSSYFVRIEYLNVTDSETVYPYKLDGCSDYDCPFDIFTNIYQPRFPRRADTECIRQLPPVPPISDASLILTLVFIIIAVAIMTFLVFLSHYLRKTNSDRLHIKDDHRSESL